MAYNNKPMLQDVNGHLIPQYYDPTSDSYQPLNDLTRVYAQGSLTAFNTASVTVGTTPTLLTAGLSGRNQLILYPPQTTGQTIYWGTSTVTTSNGAPLSYGDEPMVFDFADVTLNVYAIATASTSVRIVESK